MWRAVFAVLTSAPLCVCLLRSSSPATRRGCGPGAAIGLWLRFLPQRLVKGCAAAPHCALHVSRSVVPTGCSRAAARGGHPACTYPSVSSRQYPHGAWVFPPHVRLETTLMMGVPPRRGRACACAAVPPLLILLAPAGAPLPPAAGQGRTIPVVSAALSPLLDFFSRPGEPLAGRIPAMTPPGMRSPAGAPHSATPPGAGTPLCITWGWRRSTPRRRQQEERAIPVIPTLLSPPWCCFI